jgi:hypothetical protein
LEPVFGFTEQEVAEYARVGDGVEEVLDGDAGAPFVVRGGVEAEKGRQAEGLSEKKTPQL